ncbi:TPA: hypothetical protein N2D04_003674 [Clostridium botulinum]|nr:hypothetical protein [Clostridium botulinum]HCL4459486.1 hypothetical protein [Clostridium botulinum]HCL4463191.1 hypothetical protein [Clostridium botulinum]HCL4474163.1 hypothetical protein [Clostridium botulinum]HCL4477839.1 hypothetical protein [Clostridium botulinum]
MKKFKKIITMVLLSVFVCLLHNNVKAIDNKTNVNSLTEEQLNNILIERKAPMSAVNEMDITLKKSIISNGGVFESVKHETKYISNEQQNRNGRVKRGTLSPSKIKLSIYSVRKDAYNCDVYFSYHWDGYKSNNLPAWRGTDLMGITYDGSKFRLLSSQHMDMYSYGPYNDKVAQQTNEVNYSRDAGSGYISWNVNLRSDAVQTVNDLWGWTRISLKSDTANAKSSIYGKYTHVKAPGTIGFSYNGFSISFSGSALHDDATVYSNIN